jgi:hypothetical protein
VLERLIMVRLRRSANESGIRISDEELQRR